MSGRLLSARSSRGHACRMSKFYGDTRMVAYRQIIERSRLPACDTSIRDQAVRGADMVDEVVASELSARHHIFDRQAVESGSVQSLAQSIAGLVGSIPSFPIQVLVEVASDDHRDRGILHPEPSPLIRLIEKLLHESGPSRDTLIVWTGLVHVRENDSAY
jgi:hypothetical protein